MYLTPKFVAYGKDIGRSRKGSRLVKDEDPTILAPNGVKIGFIPSTFFELCKVNCALFLFDLI